MIHNYIRKAGGKILKKFLFAGSTGQWQSPLDNKEKWRWEKFWVPSLSGAIIHGLYRQPHKNIAVGTIVFGHPLSKKAKGWFLHGQYLEKLLSKGFNVVLFDFNGFGESSEGDFQYFEDIMAVGKKASELTPGKPIGYHGVAFGAFCGFSSIFRKKNVYSFFILENMPVDENHFINQNALPEFWYNISRQFNFFRFSPTFINGTEEGRSSADILFLHLNKFSSAGEFLAKQYTGRAVFHEVVLSDVPDESSQLPDRFFSSNYVGPILEFLELITPVCQLKLNDTGDQNILDDFA